MTDIRTSQDRVSDFYLESTLNSINLASALDSQLISTAFLRMLLIELIERRAVHEPGVTPPCPNCGNQYVTSQPPEVAFERGCYVLMEMMKAYERRVRSACKTPEEIEKRPWECAEYVAAASYLLKVWPPYSSKPAEQCDHLPNQADWCPKCSGSGERDE